MNASFWNVIWVRVIPWFCFSLHWHALAQHNVGRHTTWPSHFSQSTEHTQCIPPHCTSVKSAACITGVQLLIHMEYGEVAYFQSVNPLRFVPTKDSTYKRKKGNYLLPNVSALIFICTQEVMQIACMLVIPAVRFLNIKSKEDAYLQGVKALIFCLHSDISYLFAYQPAWTLVRTLGRRKIIYPSMQFSFNEYYRHFSFFLIYLSTRRCNSSHSLAYLCIPG